MRAPSAHGYRRVVVAASVGSLIELYDISVYGYLAIYLAGQFFPREDPTAALLATLAIFAVGFLVRPIGGIIFGHIGDRVGRRVALTLSLSLMTVATVGFGVLPTYASVGLLAPVLLLICRILQGLSASAEIPGAHLLILEHAPSGRLGRAVATNNVAINLGNAAAATVALVLARLLTPEQLAGWGWRLAFLLAAPIGLVGLYIRLRVLDSPAFAALDDAAKRGVPLARAARTAKRGMLVIAVWMGAVLLGGYLQGGFLPSFLARVVGLTPEQVFGAAVAAQLVTAAAMVAGGYLVDRFPLRRVAAGAMAGLALVSVPALWIITGYETLGATLVGQSMWALLIGVTYTVGSAMSVALFPVAIRFTATAVAFNLGGSLFGSTAPYVATWLVSATDNSSTPGYYLLALSLAGLAVALAGLPNRRLAQARSGDSPAPPPQRLADQAGRPLPSTVDRRDRR